MADTAPGVTLLLPPVYDLLWSFAALGAVVVPLSLLVWVVVRLTRGSTAPTAAGAASAARRHATAVSALAWLALVASLLVGPVVVASRPLGLGQGLMLGLVPAVAGLSLAAVQGVGELTWPRPTGTVRRAPLQRRTVADVAPRPLRLMTWAWAAVLVLTLAVTGLTAEPDGRSIGRTFTDGSAASGPFPGWFYGLPLLAATALVLLATEGTLRLIARRAAVSATAPGWDLELRRLSAHRLLRGAQLVLGLTAAGVLLIAGSATRSVGSGHVVDGVPLDSTGHVVVGTTLMLTAVVVAVTALVLTAFPATARPALAEDGLVRSRPWPGPATGAAPHGAPR